jgi:hypothetical protein
MNLHSMLTLFFSHVGRFHDTVICQLYYVGPRRIQYECSFIVRTFNRLTLGILGWSYTPNTIHMTHNASGPIRKRHCSSW